MRSIILAAILLTAAGGAEVRAQARAHRAGEGFIAARAGANIVGNTYRFRETRPVVGGGGSLGTFISPAWAVEFETWVRASNPECCVPHRRETLYSVSVVRQYARTGIQPYLLSGLTVLRARSTEMQIQVGAGAQLSVFRRMAMAVDIRGNGGGSTMILRPTVAAIYYFR